MSVVMILLMFSAAMVMVKNVDNDREQHAILSPDSSETEDTTTVRLKVEENQLVDVFGEIGTRIEGPKGSQNGRFLEERDAQNL